MIKYVLSRWSTSVTHLSEEKSDMVTMRELRLTLTEHEYQTWNTQAAASGLSVADFIRRAVNSYDVNIDAELRSLQKHAQEITDKATNLAMSILLTNRQP